MLLPPLVLLGLFYFYPLVKICWVAMRTEGAWGSGQLGTLFSSGYYLRVLWFTTWQAALSTLLTLLVALPGAYVFARYDFGGKRILRTFATVPFVLPTVVVAAAFQALLGPHGLINQWFTQGWGWPQAPIRLDQTLGFILLAHLFYNYAVVLRIVGGFWSQLSGDLTEAAQMLGASGWRTFFSVSLPLLQPALWAAGLLVFIFCFSSFGVILILGGPRFATLEVEIYRQALHLFNLPMAAALSLLQIMFTFGLMYVYTGLQRRTAVRLMPQFRTALRRRPESRSEKVLVRANVVFILLFLTLPLLALLYRSLLGEHGLWLGNYTALMENRFGSVFFVPPVAAVLNSLGFAAATLALALLVGVPAAVFLAGRRTPLVRWLDPLFMLPLATSAVTLGFGFIIALDRPPLNLRASIALVPLAHTLVAFPFVVRALLPALRSIPHSLREAAAMLGATPWQRWRCVDLPVMGRALVVGAVFAFTVSMGEFGASVFVARPQTPTMPLAIYRFLGQPGALNYGQAMAMSSLLMLVSAAGFAVLEKLRPAAAGEF